MEAREAERLLRMEQVNGGGGLADWVQATDRSLGNRRDHLDADRRGALDHDRGQSNNSLYAE